MGLPIEASGSKRLVSPDNTLRQSTDFSRVSSSPLPRLRSDFNPSRMTTRNVKIWRLPEHTSQCTFAKRREAGGMGMNRLRKRLLQMMIAILTLSVSSFAQSTGSLVGTVHDSTGAVVQGADIVATNVLTGISSRTTTNTSGDYAFPSLATGIYTLNVVASGFKPLLVQQMQIHVASTVRQDAVLSPGAVSTSVEVISSTPLLDSETAEIGQLVEASQITQLPLNGRDVYQLLNLTAGAQSRPGPNIPGTFSAGFVSANRPALAGGRPGYTVFRMDGLNINTQGLPQAAMTPNVDAVQEFRSVTQTASAAEQGASSVYVDLKSGTNKFHGTAYDFLRNNVLDAQPYFQQKIANAPGYAYQGTQLRYNQYGGTLGGPIWRNRTFFLGSVQVLANNGSTQYRGMFPTAAMLRGDFSGIYPLTGKPFGPVIDPATGQQFPNNQVPITSPMAKALISAAFLPANCMACLPLGFDFVGTEPSNQSEKQIIAHIDHHLSDKDQISGFYTRDSGVNTNASVIPSLRQNYDETVHTVGLRETHILTPHLLNAFSLGYVRYVAKQIPYQNANGAFTYFHNMPFNIPSLYPSASVFGSSSSFTESYLFNDVEYSYDFNDNLNWERGNHNISAGFEAIRDDSFYTENWNGIFLYADGLPALFGFTGYGFSDFLQGTPFAGVTYQGTGATPGVKRTFWSGYVQDNWKILPRLTVDLGFRYEVPERWRDVGSPKYNRMATLDTSSASQSVGGRFLLAGSSNFYVPGQGIVPGNGAPARDTLQKPSYTNIQPRVGFAYRPFSDNKTVIRSGFGIYYSLADENSVTFEMMTPPYQSQAVFINLFPNVPLGQPLKDTQFFPVVTAGAGALGVNPNNVDSRSYQWTLSIERQIAKNFAVSGEYVGNESAHLPVPILANQPQLPNASQLAQLLANPALDTTLAQQRAPFTNVNYGYQYMTSLGTSSYNALYLTASGQLAKGLTLSGSYAWSKALDIASSEEEVPAYTRNLGLSRSYASFDHPQRFVGSWVYDLPFGDTLLHTDSRTLNYILSGWESTGIATFEAGAPYSVSMGVDTQFTGSGTTYPNLTGPLVHNSIRKTDGIYLTPQNFVAPPFGQLGATRRNQFHGPGVNNFDLGFMRNFKLHESLTLQLRGEMFNAFNHGQFQLASQTLASSINAPTGNQTAPTITYIPASQFGRVTASSSRIGQIAAKLIF
jgi:hypothetical protein